MPHESAKDTYRENTSRGGLPTWSYKNNEITELENELVFRRNWLMVGHISTIPNTGDYMTLDVADERAVVVRGTDGKVRTFHNLCRHRGSRVVPDQQGNCGKILTCPFHGWGYNLDGGLRGVPKPETFPDLDKSKLGLKPIEQEIWHGLVFIRFKGDGPSVAEIMAPMEEEIAPYRIEDMLPYGEEWNVELDVNWKSQMDVDNEGYHVAIAHPSLHDLFAASYSDQSTDGQKDRAAGAFDDGRKRRQWTVRHYVKLLPEVTHLPESHRKAWIYHGVFPSSRFEITPDMLNFYQFLPLSTGRSVVRSRSFVLPDDRREMRAARYLNSRINRMTTAEDMQLIEWSNEGMNSSAFDELILSDLEVGVWDYHDKLRQLMPVLNLKEAPPEGTLAALNQKLSKADE